jgi:bacterioferritin
MAQAEGPFLSAINDLRQRAREHIEQGAITSGYAIDPDLAIKVLNEALATEMVCVLRYKQHYFAAVGIDSESVKAEFLEHANDELLHADRISERITQLGGNPNLNPEGMLTRSHSEYVEKPTLLEMIKEDLVAERVAIESYIEMVRFFGDRDPTSRRLMEEILAKEEEHASDLADLLLRVAPTTQSRPSAH